MTEFSCIVKRILKLSAFAYAGFGDLVNSRATDSAILALKHYDDWANYLVHNPIAVVNCNKDPSFDMIK